MRYHFDPFCLDIRAAQLSGPDGDIALRAMTLKLLCFLVQHADRVLSHEELLDAVWGRQEVTLGVLSQSVRELRRALGDSAQESRFIETKHRLGYRFIAPIERQEHVEVEPAPHSDAAVSGVMQRENPTSGQSGGKWIDRRWLALVLLPIIAGGAAWVVQRGDDDASRDALSSVEVVHAGRPQEPEARAWYRQGLTAMRAGEFASAREWLEKSLQREPQAAATLAALADVHGQAGELRVAREWAASARAAAAGLPQSDQLRLSAFSATLDYRQIDAINTLQSVYQLNPGDADTGLRLADVQIRAGRGDEAAVTLSRVGKLPSIAPLAARLALLHARRAGAQGDHAGRLQAAIDAHAVSARDDERTDALLEQSWAHLLLGDPAAAANSLDAARALLQRAPWPSAQIRQQVLHATLLREAGELDQSVQEFESAASAARQLGQLAAAAAAEREAAFVLSQKGDHAAALLRLGSLREQQAALGDPRALASTLDVSSVVAQRAGDMTAALAFAADALSAYTESNDRAGEAATRSNLGMLYARSGRAADAELQLQQALQLFQATGDRRGAAVAQSNLAILFARDGRHESAREANEQALDAFREVGATLDVARLQFNLGIQDRRAGRLVDTEARFREALAGFTRIGASDYRLQVIASLGELLLARADPEAAAQLLDGIDVSADAPIQRRAALATARGRLAALRGEFESARTDFDQALQLRVDAELVDWARMSELDLAELDAREGRLADAEQAARGLRRAMLEAKDAHAAFGAGVLLAGALAAQGQIDAAERMFDLLESELARAPDAMLGLRLDLLRAATRTEQRDAALHRVAENARATGFELLALRAELLAGGRVGDSARVQLGRRGIAIEGMPPPLPY